MADKGKDKDKGKGKPEKDKKPAAQAAKGAEKPAKAPRADKADKAEKADKGAKAPDAGGRAPEPVGPVPPPRLKTHYEETVLPALMKRFEYTNPMQAPRLVKIVVNMGVGEAIQNAKLLDAAASELGTITGQKAAIRRAKKSIANFKLRKGQAIGCMVTLRHARMWEFYDRLVNVAIPRIRDFRGVPPRSFDGRGNYTLGLTEQIIFPEINYDKIEKVRGMDVTIVTTARTDEEGRELLKLLSMPFRQPQPPAQPSAVREKPAPMPAEAEAAV